MNSLEWIEIGFEMVQKNPRIFVYAGENLFHKNSNERNEKLSSPFVQKCILINVATFKKLPSTYEVKPVAILQNKKEKQYKLTGEHIYLTS